MRNQGGHAGAGSGASEIEAARLLLARLGVSPAELLAGDAPRDPLPRFAEYVPVVAAAVPDGTRKAYEPYWDRIVQQWGARRLDEPTALEVKALAERVRRGAVVRRNSRGGRSAAEHLISALRCLYQHAVADDLLQESDNPAARVSKPRRLPSTRHALSQARVRELNQVAVRTGNDPVLDGLLLRLHSETACRRGGALALRPLDLDGQQCLILLREKGDTQRWQPVSPTLMRQLHRHAHERGGSERSGALLRYRGGKPLTSRRYDYLWSRLRAQLPWARAQQVSTHWLRHTTLTWVERHFGYAVARAYAGHNDSSSAGVTATYIRADIVEVATALAALTGEYHPLLATG